MSESLNADEIVAELRNDIQEQNKQLDEAYAEIDAKDKLLKEKDKEIAELKKAAAAAGVQAGGDGDGDAGESLTADQIVEELRNDIKEQNKQLDEAYAEIDAKAKEIADLKKQLIAAGSTGGGGGSSAADAEEIKKLKEKIAKLKAAMNALLDA